MKRVYRSSERQAQAPPGDKATAPRKYRRGYRQRRPKVGQNSFIGRGNPVPETGGYARQRAIEQGKFELCGAIKKDGTLCGNLAGRGTTHKGSGPCMWHGGSTPAASKRAALVRAKDQVGVLSPVVPDEDVNEMGHIKEALRESVARLRGWRKYLSTLTMQELLTPEGMYVVDAERKERLAGARVAMYGLSMGLTKLQIAVEQGQVDKLGAALVAVLDEYEDGYASREKRTLMGVLLRKYEYTLDGGDDPDELARLDQQVAAARAALAATQPAPDAPVQDADVVPAPDPLWSEFEQGQQQGTATG